jgi:hypothetical protein
MTSVVGIRCTNGVVIGTDGAATFGVRQFKTMKQPTKKIDVIADKIIVACTGHVGLAQRFCYIIEKLVQKDLFKKDHMEVTNGLCRVTLLDMKNTFTEPNPPQRPGRLGALVAFPCGDGMWLYEFGVDDFQPEFKDDPWYASMGSAIPITDPFLAFLQRVFWKTGPPDIQNGILIATWALRHAIDVNPGGVGEPIQIAILQQVEDGHKAEILDADKLAEHRQQVEALESEMAKLPNELLAEPDDEIPSIPEPPTQ